jgi:hypothetical protein
LLDRSPFWSAPPGEVVHRGPAPRIGQEERDIAVDIPHVRSLAATLVASGTRRRVIKGLAPLALVVAGAAAANPAAADRSKHDCLKRCEDHDRHDGCKRRCRQRFND